LELELFAKQLHYYFEICFVLKFEREVFFILKYEHVPP
jgi:hypothetical protein